MAGFLYFIPGVPGVTQETLDKLGLGSFIDVNCGQCNVSDGPAKKGGIVIAGTPEHPQGKAATPGYYPKIQEWTPEPEKRYWIGYEKANRPQPVDLERGDIIAGHSVKLADGNIWQVPVARAINGSTPLPRRLSWNGKGWIYGDVLEQYKELFAQACRIWDLIVEAEKAEVTLTDECNVAAMALGLNYRLGPLEISFLGLFDTRTEVEVVKAVIDWPMLEEVKKKLELGEISLDAGNKDS